MAAAVHAFQLVKYRSWYFTTVAVGCLLEIVGYIARSFSASTYNSRIVPIHLARLTNPSEKSPYNVIYFVVAYFFIVCAPVLFSGAIYTVISVLINRTDRKYAPLPPKTILWIFIVCDVVATVVQVAGAALIGVAESNRRDPTTANNILLAGLAFQVFAFFIFLALMSVFLFRARRHIGSPRSIRDKRESNEQNVIPATFLVAFLIATIMIYLRTCFRLAETAQGLGGSLSTNEVYFGCLEFAPVVIAVYIFIAWHPGRCLPSRTPGM